MASVQWAIVDAEAQSRRVEPGRQGALKPTKIGRRLVFKKGELDRLLAKGDGARGIGRPRKGDKQVILRRFCGD